MWLKHKASVSAHTYRRADAFASGYESHEGWPSRKANPKQERGVIPPNTIRNVARRLVQPLVAQNGPSPRPGHVAEGGMSNVWPSWKFFSNGPEPKPFTDWQWEVS